MGVFGSFNGEKRLLFKFIFIFKNEEILKMYTFDVMLCLEVLLHSTLTVKFPSIITGAKVAMQFFRLWSCSFAFVIIAPSVFSFLSKKSQTSKKE